MSPRVCPQPEPDCPLYDQRLASNQDEALHRAILSEQREGVPTLADLIRTEALRGSRHQPLLLPAPEPVSPLPLPVEHRTKGTP